MPPSPEATPIGWSEHDEGDLDETGDQVLMEEESQKTIPNMEKENAQQLPSWFVIQVTAIASLGGILFGYDLGVISGALPQLQAAFDLNERQQETCVSILYLGGGLGAAVGGSLCDAWGRKRAILITDVIFTLGAVILLSAANFESIVIGRVVVGFALALSGIADVTYLHEIAPPHLRGAIVSVNEACISLGFLLAFGTGAAFSSNVNGWRIMFGLSGAIACVQFVGMLSLPESPKWLKQYGRLEECAVAYKRIHGNQTTYSAEDQLGETYQAAQLPPNMPSSPSMQEIASIDTPNNMKQRFNVCLAHLKGLYKDYRQFLISLAVDYPQQSIIALFLAFTQQACGQANVLSYAPSIFDFFGESEQWSTLSIGVVKFFVTIVVIWKIDSLGRRFLLLTGIAVLALGLFCLAIAFLSHHGQETSAKILALPGVLLIVSGYSMSFGPLTWLLTSELFPTEIRGRALGISTIFTYFCASVVTNTFLTAQALLGHSVVYSIYLLLTVAGFFFAWLAIPDTGNKTTDELGTRIASMPWWLKKERGHILVV